MAKVNRARPRVRVKGLRDAKAALRQRLVSVVRREMKRIDGGRLSTSADSLKVNLLPDMDAAHRIFVALKPIVQKAKPAGRRPVQMYTGYVGGKHVDQIVIKPAGKKAA